MQFGVIMFPTDYSIGVVELGKAAEGAASGDGHPSPYAPRPPGVPSGKLPQKVSTPSGGQGPGPCLSRKRLGSLERMLCF